jgi:site-specific DNA recombinase
MALISLTTCDKSHTFACMEAIALIRCSTHHQVDGTSLENQTRRITAYCEAEDMKLVRIYEEAGISGLTNLSRRDALNAALDEVCRRKCALVILSLSRLSRSLRDSLAILERVEKAGGTVISLTEKIDSRSASGKLVTNMMMLLHNFEVMQLRERVTSSMSMLRLNQKRISRFAPYGYDFSFNRKDLVKNPAERDAVERMKEMRAAGFSFRAIAGALKDAPTKTGAKWSATVVRGILVRESKLALAA